MPACPPPSPARDQVAQNFLRSILVEFFVANFFWGQFPKLAFGWTQNPNEWSAIGSLALIRIMPACPPPSPAQDQVAQNFLLLQKPAHQNQNHLQSAVKSV